MNIVAVANEQYNSFNVSEDKRVTYEELQKNINVKIGLLGFAKQVKKKRFIYLLMNPRTALHKIKYRNDSLYEIIPPDVPIKLFFDIDHCDIPPHFFDIVNTKLISHYPEIQQPIPYLILSACSGSSSLQSYHVIYPSIIFVNMSHLKSFIIAVFKSEFPSIIDFSVYTTFRLFRPYFASKYNENRRFIQFKNTVHPKGLELSDNVVFLLSLISYFQIIKPVLIHSSYLSEISSKNSIPFKNINAVDPAISAPFPHSSNRLLDFKNFIQNSIITIHNSHVDVQEKFLQHSNRNLVSYHLKNFPCPYHFPKIHIHRKNRPFILFSLNDIPSLDVLQIRCHKENEASSVSLRKYLDGNN